MEYRGEYDPIWFKVFTVYQKDPRLLEEWIGFVEKDLDRALEIARGLTVAEERPDTVVLGFSPQILLAIASISRGGVKVITSPEVWSRGGSGPGRFSHRLLKILYERGLVSMVVETPLAPSKDRRPSDIIQGLVDAIERIRPSIVDISGGTQLAAIAIARKVKVLTYTYPMGDHVHIYRLKI